MKVSSKSRGLGKDSMMAFPVVLQVVSDQRETSLALSSLSPTNKGIQYKVFYKM